jgi:hypothetical protein
MNTMMRGQEKATRPNARATSIIAPQVCFIFYAVFSSVFPLYLQESTTNEVSGGTGAVTSRIDMYILYLHDKKPATHCHTATQVAV